MSVDTKIKIKGKQIEKIITKYYYKNDKLHFSILLRMAGTINMVKYEDFDTYNTYKSTFNYLILAKEQNDDLALTFNKILKTSQIK